MFALYARKGTECFTYRRGPSFAGWWGKREVMAVEKSVPKCRELLGQIMWSLSNLDRLWAVSHIEDDHLWTGTSAEAVMRHGHRASWECSPVVWFRTRLVRYGAKRSLWQFICTLGGGQNGADLRSSLSKVAHELQWIKLISYIHWVVCSKDNEPWLKLFLQKDMNSSYYAGEDIKSIVTYIGGIGSLIQVYLH